MATSPPTQASRFASRLSLLGAAVGVAGVVAALAFGASAATLLASPQLYGVDFDASVEPLEGDDAPADVRAWALQTAARIKGPAVAAVAVTQEGTLPLAIPTKSLANPANSVSIPVQTVEPLTGASAPVLREGRGPTTAYEVALGAKTLRSLKLGVGDAVRPLHGTTPLQIVGVYVFVGGDELNDGALLSVDGFRTLVGPPARAFVRIRFAPGVSTAAGVAVLKPAVPGSSPWRTPSSVDNLHQLGSLPLTLGVFLGLLACVAGSHSLSSTIHGHRGEFALLRALGFTRGQLRWTLRWQAITVAVVGLMLGIPFGLSAARNIWAHVAETLGVVDQPAAPWAVIAASVPVALVIATLLATPPGVRATRGRPAEILRAE